MTYIQRAKQLLKEMEQNNRELGRMVWGNSDELDEIDREIGKIEESIDVLKDFMKDK